MDTILIVLLATLLFLLLKKAVNKIDIAIGNRIRDKNTLEKIKVSIDNNVMKDYNVELIILKIKHEWLVKILLCLPEKEIKDEYGYKINSVITCTENGQTLLKAFYDVLNSDAYILHMMRCGATEEEARVRGARYFNKLVDQMYEEVVKVNNVIRRHWT